MKKLAVAAVAAALFVPATSPSLAADASPIFASAKVQKLDQAGLKSVVGQGTTSSYYAYLGNYYASAAIQAASYGAYLEAFGNATYAGTRYSYYNSAANYAYYAYSYYLTARNNYFS